MKPHQTSFRVRYAETDQMGVAHHASYLTWMEVARVEWCRAWGADYQRLETEDGVLLAVVEARCRYAAPARFDDLITVKTWVEQASPRLLRFAYEIRREDGKTLATGQTSHVFVGADFQRRRLPEKHWGVFGIPPSCPAE